MNFQEIYNKCKLNESMSEKDEYRCFHDWNPLERDWVVCPNPDDYDSMLHEYAKKWLGQFNLDNDIADKITSAISNAFWNGNSRGFANAKGD